MKTHFLTAAALVLTLGATAVSADSSQLAASAGIDAAAAEGMTLNEIARIKFNAEARRDDQQPIVGASAGASLTELAVAKVNRGAPRRDELIPVVVSSRSVAMVGGAGRAQLAASAGFSPEEARTMSLHEIYRAKTIRESTDN